MGSLCSLVLTIFLTLGSGFVITAPTPTAAIPEQRTLYGALAPTETFFQIRPPIDANRELYKRKVITTTLNTCGWTSADANRPKTCPAGLGCGWIYGDRRSDYGVVCVPYDDMGEVNWADAILPTACYGYGRLNISIASAYSQTWNTSLFCGTSAPHCATAVFDGGPTLSSGPASFSAYTFTSMFCTDEVTKVRVYQAVTNSMSGSANPSSSRGLSSSSAPATSSTDGSNGSLPQKSNNNKSKPGSVTSPSPTKESQHSTPVGAIAGAAVGGVLVVGAIAALTGFLIWRRSQSRKGRKGTPFELSQEVRHFTASPRYSAVRS